MCERLILQRLSSPHVILYNILPSSQFGFCTKHNKIHQDHRLVDAISTSLECRKILFLYIFRHFAGIRSCIARRYALQTSQLSPPSLFLLIKSYFIDQFLLVHEIYNIPSLCWDVFPKLDIPQSMELTGLEEVEATIPMACNTTDPVKKIVKKICRGIYKTKGPLKAK